MNKEMNIFSKETMSGIVEVSTIQGIFLYLPERKFVALRSACRKLLAAADVEFNRTSKKLQGKLQLSSYYFLHVSRFGCFRFFFRKL